jgi:arylsulfatase A-like enzyme
MKLRKKIWIALFLFLGVVSVLFTVIHHKRKLEFDRISLSSDHWDRSGFDHDRVSGSILYNEKNEEIKISIPGSEVYYFNLRGEQSIQIEHKITGQTGFYTFLYLKSQAKEKIHCRLSLQKGGEKTEIAQIQKVRFRSPFIRSFDSGKKDKLILSFEGNGIVAFSVPIVYRKTDLTEKNYIFLIGADTLRADYVGMTVNGLSLTPNIDLFRKDSANFSNCYSQSSWTLPAFMNLFTALYEYNHGVTRGSSLDPDKPFLVKELAKKFLTFSYNGGAFVDQRYGFSNGFDGYMSLEALIHSGSGKIMFSRAIDLIEKTEFPKLFLFLHTYQLHNPYAPKTEFLHKINKDPEVLKFSGFHAKTKYKRVPEEKVRAFRELYQAEILEFDHYFGEFIGRLKDLNLYDSSMIIFMSDHGEEFYDHMGWSHGHSLYNELIRVPLMIKFPQNKYGGMRISENVGIIDIFPTILDLNKIKFNSSSVDGKSLLPLIRGKKWRRDSLYSSLSTCWMVEAIPPKFSILAKDLKLIVNYPFKENNLEFFGKDAKPPEIERLELFDLRKDTKEKSSIADQKNIPEDFRSIISELQMTINKAIASSKRGKLILSEEEIEKLKALGYIGRKP